MTFSRSRTCGRAQNNFDRSGARRIAGPVIVGLALGALHFGSADAQEVIDTTPAWNGTASIAAWGVPNTATYGQTFTATDQQRRLLGFTFYLQNFSGTAPKYQAAVYEWNNATSRITGPALFTSAVMTAPGGSGYTAVKISTGNIALDTGKRYVMFFTTSTQGAQHNGSYKWGSVNGTTYAGGDFMFKNNGTNFNQLSTSNWSIFGALDLAFNAEFGFANFIALAHTNNQLSVATALQAVAEGTPKGTAGTIINILEWAGPGSNGRGFRCGVR